MQPTISIDTRRWNELALSLSVALKKDAGEVLRDESRLFLKQCISFTPPRNKKQGENAIAGDLFGRSQFQKGQRSPGIFSKIPEAKRHFYTESDSVIVWADGGRIVAVGDANLYRPGATMETMRSHHYKNKTKRGRVSQAGAWTKNIGRWKARTLMFVQEQTANQYLKSLFNRVGRLKAGWLPAFTRLGGKAKAWIQRHQSGARGYIVDNSSNPTAPYIDMENHAAGVGETKRIVNNALRARQSAMARRLKLILGAYSADVAKGIRARSKARRTPSSATAN